MVPPTGQSIAALLVGLTTATALAADGSPEGAMRPEECFALGPVQFRPFAEVGYGYDDNIWVDINSNGTVDSGEKGAFRIANSWGTGWGEGGYGWLPYAYVTSGLADEFWSLFKAKYVDTKQFS